MSCIDLDTSPGTLLVARINMRAWERDDVRGTDGPWIRAGERALVLVSWRVGKWLRLKVICADRIMMFSCQRHVAARNWNIAGCAIGTPTSGSS